MTATLVIICIFSCLYCLLRPFHRNNVYYTAKVLGKVTKIFGLDVEVRVPESVKNISPAVYICNHQNSYDIFTAANAVLPNTVSVGKKSLKWIPFFGQMYWLTGNILIDRKNTNKAINTIALTAKKIRDKNISVWLFPEGTRSNGKGILPFKTGAFRTAMQADVPIIPICVSNMHKKVNLNRWDNGKIIIEYMEPISMKNITKDNVRAITNTTRDNMKAHFERLNIEAEQ